MTKGLFLMSEMLFEKVYSADTRRKINRMLDETKFVEAIEEADPAFLKEVEYLFGGWGTPELNKETLDMMPNLKVIFYAAGTMKHVLTDEVWNRGIRVTNASVANSIPVAEYTLAAILFSLKSAWRLMYETKVEKKYPFGTMQDVPGAYKSKVGIVSYSNIGRRVIDLLKPFDLDILVYDPYVDPASAEDKVDFVSLEELFEASDVVSLHTPLLPETKGMIDGDLFSRMKKDATFINTARGAIVNEKEMLDVLAERQDLTAVLDVTTSEPPAEDSPLYDLKNVILTPHIAGSSGKERERLGDTMLQELLNYEQDGHLEFELVKNVYERMA